MKRRDFILRTLSLGISFLISTQGFADDKKLPFLLVVHCDGGWDQNMVFDNKKSVPKADYETDVTVKSGAGGISYLASPSRPLTSSFFDTYGDNALILNGVYNPSLSYEKALLSSVAGYNTRTGYFTDWLAFYAAQVAPDLSMPYVAIGAPYVAYHNGSFITYLDNSIIKNFQTSPLSDVVAFKVEEEAALIEYINWSHQAASTRLNQDIDRDKFKTFSSSLLKDASIEKAVRALKISDTDDELTKHGKIALNFFKQGYTQAASIQSGAKGSWNTHSDHYASQTKNFEALFTGLSHIISEAKTLEIDQNLVIIVKSELGRSSVLNVAKGKDRWPYTSVLIWSPLVKGGKVLGKTDDQFLGVPIDPLFGDYEGSQPKEMLTLGHIYAAFFEYAGVSAKLIQTLGSPALFLMKI